MEKGKIQQKKWKLENLAIWREIAKYGRKAQWTEIPWQIIGMHRMLGGVGGVVDWRKGGMLYGLDVNPPQATNPSNTAYYIIHHVAF